MMTTARQRIHQYISEHPNTTVTEIAKALSVSRSCVSPQVSNLFKDGLLSRSGNHQEYRYSSGPATDVAEKTTQHMSQEMALFNKLLRGARA